MKKKLLLLCCVAGVAGCVRGLYDDGREKAPPMSPVYEAHSYFDKHAGAIAMPEMLSKAQKSRTTPRIVLTPNWAEASCYDVDSAHVVDVPLRSNFEMSVTCQSKQLDGTTKSFDLLRIDSRLTMVQTPETDVQMFVATMIPDWHGLFHWATETRFMHPDNDFSGMVVLSDLDGNEIDAPSEKIGTRTLNSVGTRSKKCIILHSGYCLTHKLVHADTAVVIGKKPESDISRNPFSCGCNRSGCHRQCVMYVMPQEAPGSSGGSSSETTPPTTPSKPTEPTKKPTEPTITAKHLDDSRTKLKPILTNKRIKNAMLLPNATFIANSEVNIMQAYYGRYEANTAGAYAIVAHGIFFNEVNVACFNEKGLFVLIAHEYIHLALAIDKPGQVKTYSKNHDNLINDPGWMQCLKDIFPGENQDFYDKMKYAGCEDAPSWLALPETEQLTIKAFITDKLKKKP